MNCLSPLIVETVGALNASMPEFIAQLRRPALMLSAHVRRSDVFRGFGALELHLRSESLGTHSRVALNMHEAHSSEEWVHVVRSALHDMVEDMLRYEPPSPPTMSVPIPRDDRIGAGNFAISRQTLSPPVDAFADMAAWLPTRRDASKERSLLGKSPPGQVFVDDAMGLGPAKEKKPMMRLPKCAEFKRPHASWEERAALKEWHARPGRIPATMEEIAEKRDAPQHVLNLTDRALRAKREWLAAAHERPATRDFGRDRLRLFDGPWFDCEERLPDGFWAAYVDAADAGDIDRCRRLASAFYERRQMIKRGDDDLRRAMEPKGDL